MVAFAGLQSPNVDEHYILEACCDCDKNHEDNSQNCVLCAMGTLEGKTISDASIRFEPNPIDCRADDMSIYVHVELHKSGHVSHQGASTFQNKQVLLVWPFLGVTLRGLGSSLLSP